MGGDLEGGEWLGLATYRRWKSETGTGNLWSRKFTGVWNRICLELWGFVRVIANGISFWAPVTSWLSRYIQILNSKSKFKIRIQTATRDQIQVQISNPLTKTGNSLHSTFRFRSESGTIPLLESILRLRLCLKRFNLAPDWFHCRFKFKHKFSRYRLGLTNCLSTRLVMGHLIIIHADVECVELQGRITFKQVSDDLELLEGGITRLVVVSYEPTEQLWAINAKDATITVA